MSDHVKHPYQLVIKNGRTSWVSDHHDLRAGMFVKWKYMHAVYTANYADDLRLGERYSRRLSNYGTIHRTIPRKCSWQNYYGPEWPRVKPSLPLIVVDGNSVLEQTNLPEATTTAVQSIRGIPTLRKPHRDVRVKIDSSIKHPNFADDREGPQWPKSKPQPGRLHTVGIRGQRITTYNAPERANVRDNPS